MTLAAFAFSFVGFAALALSMARHHGDVFGRPPTRRHTLGARAIGWLLLAASVAAAIHDTGVSVGIVLWSGTATMTSMSVALLLTYRARWWRGRVRRQ